MNHLYPVIVMNIYIFPLPLCHVEPLSMSLSVVSYTKKISYNREDESCPAYNSLCSVPCFSSMVVVIVVYFPVIIQSKKKVKHPV